MGWGSSTRRGGGRKVRALPRKFVFLGFRREEFGMSRNFAGMSRIRGGVQKVCVVIAPTCYRAPEPRNKPEKCHLGCPGRMSQNGIFQTLKCTFEVSGFRGSGRPGCRTMEMNGGSSSPYLACAPCVPCFVFCSIGVETEGFLDCQGRAGIIS